MNFGLNLKQGLIILLLVIAPIVSSVLVLLCVEKDDKHKIEIKVNKQSIDKFQTVYYITNIIILLFCSINLIKDFKNEYYLLIPFVSNLLLLMGELGEEIAKGGIKILQKIFNILLFPIITIIFVSISLYFFSQKDLKCFFIYIIISTLIIVISDKIINKIIFDSNENYDDMLLTSFKLSLIFALFLLGNKFYEEFEDLMIMIVPLYLYLVEKAFAKKIVKYLLYPYFNFINTKSH